MVSGQSLTVYQISFSTESRRLKRDQDVRVFLCLISRKDRKKEPVKINWKGGQMFQECWQWGLPTAVLNSWSGRKDGRKGIHRSWIPLKMSSCLIYCAEAEANKAKKECRERKIQLEEHSLWAEDASCSTIVRKKGRLVHSYTGYYNNWSPGERNTGQWQAGQLPKAFPPEPTQLINSSITSCPQWRDQVLKESNVFLLWQASWKLGFSTTSSFTSGFCQATHHHP